jgi:GntR family transcriptional regulator, transcriptional repressor for pyruvate dehydrogenase complex
MLNDVVDAVKPAGVPTNTYGQLTRPLRLPKMAEVVAEYIRRDIVTGVLKEGESLPAAAVLIERFGVSKPTIREALRILESETLIEVRRGATGARVQLPSEIAAGRSVGILLQLDQTTLKDVWQARVTFEPPLAGLLAKSWVEEDMAKLQNGLENSRQALSDPIKFAESQTDFHNLVVTLAGNRTLALMARLLNEVVRLHESAVNTDREHDALRTTALKEHEDFVVLLQGRREDEAESFWRTHLETNAKNLLGDSGFHTVLDLYSNLLARQELRLRL